MKWGRLKHLTEMLLSGDTGFPLDDEDKALALLQYAFETVAIRADAKCLIVEEGETPEPHNIVRINTNGHFIRRPRLPESDEDELDMDEGLIFAVARLMASFLSVEKFNVHYQVADSIMNKYGEMMISISEAYNGGWSSDD